MTQQDIFDIVAAHLWTQGKQSKEGKDCLYRSSTGLSCAIGCLIPDAEYKPEMETQGVFSIVDPKEPSIYSPTIYALYSTKLNDTLLCALQTLHDADFNWKTPQALKNALSILAENFRLSADILSSFVEPEAPSEPTTLH